ncbi:MAG: hypothetical protein CM1200mP16_13010 [Nitrospina sp.]|nr:MAG: hypothetical protein CM1200mP16_13010 [Nitrospina sp.]
MCVWQVKENEALGAIYQRPEKADAEIWDRKPKPLSKRGVFEKNRFSHRALAIGSQIPFFRNMPGGFIPLALAERIKKELLRVKRV